MQNPWFLQRVSHNRITSYNVCYTKLLRIEVYEERDPIVRHIHINYGSDIEQAITAIQTEIKKDDNRNKNYSTRYLSIKLLEDDANTRELLKNNANYDAITGKADRNNFV